MDPLVGRGDGRLHAQQRRPLGGPVPRRSRAVFLAGHDDGGGPLLAVAHGHVVDGLDLAVREVPAPAALLLRRQPVAEPDVGEGAPHHHLVVAAAAAVGVEVLRLDAVVHEVLRRGAVLGDGAGGRDVVGGDAVAHEGQHPGAVDVLHRRRLAAHVDEVRRLLDVGAVVLPGEPVALGHRQLLPPLVALEHAGVLAGEVLALHRRLDDLLDLHLGRPDVLEEHAPAVLRCRWARCRGRCPWCPPARRPPPAAARPGSWPARPG